MKNIIRIIGLILIFICSACFADENNDPKMTFPVNGIDANEYPDFCKAIFRQLPTNATILRITVYTTDKVIGVTTAEPIDRKVTRVLHVFTKEGKKWIHSQSHPKNEINKLGLSNEDIQILLVLLKPKLIDDDKILWLWIDENEVSILTGGLARPLAGSGKAYIFAQEEGKWIFKRKSQWYS